MRQTLRMINNISFLALQDLALLLFLRHNIPHKSPQYQLEPNEQWLPLMVNGCLHLKLPFNKCEAGTTTLLPS